ncbi:MAG TPA: hypothetical protein VFL66_07320 [Gaiellaceae bacterium]|nr:hypothetical protein [Gaiellaceae bacterium]
MLDRAPDYLEPIIGWRVWVIVLDERGVPRLRSVVQKTEWPTGEALVAECCQRRVLAKLLRRPQHGPAPLRSCQCGVYATQLAELEPLLAEAPWETGARVLGRVSLWGEVVECERGWRASHAYPARLYVPVRDGRRPRLSQEEIALGLADYGVPVELLPCRPSQAVTLLARQTVRRRRRSNAA